MVREIERMGPPWRKPDWCGKRLRLTVIVMEVGPGPACRPAEGTRAAHASLQGVAGYWEAREVEGGARRTLLLSSIRRAKVHMRHDSTTLDVSPDHDRRPLGGTRRADAMLTCRGLSRSGSSYDGGNSGESQRRDLEHRCGPSVPEVGEGNVHEVRSALCDLNHTNDVKEDGTVGRGVSSLPVLPSTRITPINCSGKSSYQPAVWRCQLFGVDC